MFTFGFRGKLTLSTLVLFPFLLGMGLWQLSRFHEKQTLEKLYVERRLLTPVSLEQVSQFDDPMHLPLALTGRYQHQYAFLLDNQVNQGVAGYDVIMPFETSAGQQVLVNRGWVEAGDRNRLPDIAAPQGELVIFGIVYRLMGRMYVMTDTPLEDGWPKRIQTVDFDQMGDQLGQMFPPWLVKLQPNEPGSYYVRSTKLRTSSDRHLGYALQWFSMAIVLLCLYIRRMMHSVRLQRRSEDTTLM